MTLENLAGRTVAILGYGNQGSAHAANLRDRGVDVIVGARPDGRAAANARAADFDVRNLADAAAAADLVVFALPDEVQSRLYHDGIGDALRTGSTIGFLHGFAIHFNLIAPREDLGVVLVAPKGPGTAVRDRFLQGQGVPCLFALHRESARGDAEALGRAWAAGIGGDRAAIIDTTFEAETITDLFGEQAVLCGGMLALIVAAFETLVEAGYDPKLAYMECCQEVKQIGDLIFDRGPAGMAEAISTTAEFGAHVAQPIVDDEALRARLRDQLAAIRSGAFAERFIGDAASGATWLHERRKALEDHPIEDAGRAVRTWLPWLRGEQP